MSNCICWNGCACCIEWLLHLHQKTQNKTVEHTCVGLFLSFPFSSIFYPSANYIALITISILQFLNLFLFFKVIFFKVDLTILVTLTFYTFQNYLVYIYKNLWTSVEFCQMSLLHQLIWFSSVYMVGYIDFSDINQPCMPRINIT